MRKRSTLNHPRDIPPVHPGRLVAEEVSETPSLTREMLGAIRGT